jgi:hypothetical protein
MRMLYLISFVSLSSFVSFSLSLSLNQKAVCVSLFKCKKNEMNQMEMMQSTIIITEEENAVAVKVKK